MVLPVNGIKMPPNFSDWVTRVCPPCSSSANWCVPSKIPGTSSRPIHRSVMPGLTTSTRGRKVSGLPWDGTSRRVGVSPSASRPEADWMNGFH